MDQHKHKTGFLLGFLHVDPVRQADDHRGNQEAHHNSDHHLGLVAVLKLVCNEDAKKEGSSDTSQRFIASARLPTVHAYK